MYMKLIKLRKELKDLYIQQDKDPADVDFIISELLHVSRTELNLIENVDDQEEQIIREYALKRLNTDIPIDKLFNKAYFYGLNFYIDEFVLSPRQDSEILVDTAIKYIKENEYKTCLDMCTGSGCIAIAIKKNTQIDMLASDISNKALRVAKKNVKINDVEIEFVKSDMFEKVEGKFDLIVSNPPYIASDDIEYLDKEVRDYDPLLSLDGGDMGLKFYNEIHNEARRHLNDHGMLILEIGYDQKQLIISLFNDFNLIESVKDLNGIDRVLVFTK